MMRRRKRSALSITLLFGRIGLRLICYIVLVIAAFAVAGRAFTFGYSVFHSSPMTGAPGRDVAVTVTEEMSNREIGELLVRKELIRDVNVFVTQAAIYNYKLYPGTYILNTAQDIKEMISIMSTEPETQAGGSSGTVIPTRASGGEQ